MFNPKADKVIVITGGCHRRNECVYHCNYQTQQEAITDNFSFIVGFYNRQWLHSSLEYFSPDEFERRYYLSLS